MHFADTNDDRDWDPCLRVYLSTCFPVYVFTSLPLCILQLSCSLRDLLLHPGLELIQHNIVLL